MPKYLPIKDFRARRIVLTRGDFAYAPNPPKRPSDRIERRIWNGIVTLPDDVAVRTSNYHGTALKQLSELWDAWIESYGDDHDCMFAVMLDAADDFQAATYTALAGYYRLSISALHSALEIVSIGAWAQVCGKQKEFDSWRAGKIVLSLGQACDGLIAGARSIETELQKIASDSLFAQKSAAGEGGFVRRAFSGISDFAHARPGSTDGDMRKSNGPIYVRSAFNHVSWIYFETFALCFVLVLLARPKTSIPQAVTDLFMDLKRAKSRVTRAAFQILTTDS